MLDGRENATVCEKKLHINKNWRYIPYSAFEKRRTNIIGIKNWNINPTIFPENKYPIWAFNEKDLLFFTSILKKVA